MKVEREEKINELKIIVNELSIVNSYQGSEEVYQTILTALENKLTELKAITPQEE